jgi:hypothetical protein
MNWTERRANRRNRILIRTSDEDVVGRRILNGLGLVARQVPEAVEEAFGEYDRDEALVDSALALLRYRVRSLSAALPSIEVRTVKSAAEALEIIGFHRSGTGTDVVVMSRMGKDAYAFRLVPEEEMTRLKPPFKGMPCTVHGHVAVTQPVEAYVTEVICG